MLKTNPNTNSFLPITVIGGSNIDIMGKPSENLVMQDSNPGVIQSSLGGVGRNIAENINKLGLEVNFITAVGNDTNGQRISKHCLAQNISFQHSLVSDTYPTSCYLYIIDKNGDMSVAVSDMEITKLLTPDFFEPKIAELSKAEFTVIDANLPQESIEFLASNLNNTKLVLDPVSTAKVVRTKNVLDKLYCIKINRLEAEALTGQKISCEKSLNSAGKKLLQSGVSKVFITLGDEGVYYCDLKTSITKPPKPTHTVNATGAGDAFTAAVVYCLSKNYSPEKSVNLCQKAAAITLESSEAIADKLNATSLQ